MAKKGRGWWGDSAGHSRAAKRGRGGSPKKATISSKRALKQNIKLRASLTSKRILGKEKKLTLKAKKRMGQRMKANFRKYGVKPFPLNKSF